MEGIIVAHEAIHSARKLRSSSMIIKLDILKIYNLMDRRFTLSVLNRFRFGEKWVEWVGSYIKNPKNLVLVNIVSQGFFET